MSKVGLLSILLITFLPLEAVLAQNASRVDIDHVILADALKKSCRTLELGTILTLIEPEYPLEAAAGRIDGNVKITITVDGFGNPSKIVAITGTTDFRENAGSASRKLKFSPTICNGKAIPVTASISYNFIARAEPEDYFFPTDVKEFADLTSKSPYYFPISTLTDNYRISFGYSDNKFHENAPLTRGDFAQFLRLTLDLLFKRAAEAKKTPRTIGLPNGYNPQKLSSVNSIRDLRKEEPFYQSVGILLQTYDIALVDNEMRFNGKKATTRNEVIELWARIFTKEATPVNFEKVENDQIFSRGEFALFLQESLQVLTYKVLP